MARSTNQKVEPLRSPWLTIAESADDLASMCEQVNQVIQPAGFIERMYADDVIAFTWDILRWRRSKTAIINAAILAALQALLEQLLDSRDFVPGFHHEQAAEDLARGWFANKRAKSQVTALLRKFGLDEGAIEAEAIRARAEDLERLDRMLAALEFRRDKTLRFVADYRQLLSKQLRQAGDRILEHDEVPRLVAVVKRPD